MNRDLSLAILAMDSYNRSYEQRLELKNDSEIGGAKKSKKALLF